MGSCEVSLICCFDSVFGLACCVIALLIDFKDEIDLNLIFIEDTNLIGLISLKKLSYGFGFW